MKVKRSGEE